MNNEYAILVVKMHKRNKSVDVKVPLNITANELVTGLNSAYDLGIDVAKVQNCYLKAENPIALLKGNRLLSEFGIHNGTVIHVTE